MGPAHLQSRAAVQIIYVLLTGAPVNHWATAPLLKSISRALFAEQLSHLTVTPLNVFVLECEVLPTIEYSL